MTRAAYLKNLSDMHKAQITLLEADNSSVPSIKNVWVYNFEEELEKITALLEQYPFVAMVSLLPLIRLT